MTSALDSLIQSISGFNGWPHADKIKLFAWYCHTHGGIEEFSATNIRKCYEAINLEQPSGISPFLNAMATRSPKQALKNRSQGTFKLERSVREEFDRRYGRRAATVHVDKLLTELPSKLHDHAERTYLDEALVCFRNNAFRAAIVMTWNVAYDHLCQHVLTHELAKFNTQLPKSFRNADIQVIVRREDFNELKESQVLQVCKSSNIIGSTVYKIAKEKLDRRNIAAHPSGVIILPETAEEFIKDLILNFVLRVGQKP